MTSLVDIFFPDADPPATIESYSSALTPVPAIPDPEAYDERLEEILERGVAISPPASESHAG